MTEQIVMWIVCFGCAIFFFAIGIYAEHSKTPMWFWSGTSVDPREITDVKRYNRANGMMWKLYSLWYFAAGIAEIWSTLVAAGILIASCTVGLGILIYSYNRIYQKYKAR